MLKLAIAAIACLSLAFSSECSARPRGGIATGAAITFVGVADVETTINHCFGMVACSAALAASGVMMFDLTNNSTTCLGVRAAATGKADTTVGLFCNGGTQTVTAWCSTNCVSGGSARVSKGYDQLNPGSIVETPVSYAVSPDFILAGIDGQPTMGCVSSRSTEMDVTLTAFSAGQSYGATFSVTANGGNGGAIITDAASFYMGTGDTAANTIGTQFFTLGSGQLNAAATDATGPTDFTPSHWHRSLTTAPAGTNPVVLYIDGATVGTSGSVGGPNTSGTTFNACGNAAAFSSIDANNTLWWTDSGTVGATMAQAVTNLTTVPLP